MRGVVPSEAVTSDDPGHKYHVLKDGKVVATTTPQLLAPDSAVSKRAVHLKQAPDVEVIAACQQFEITIGNHMAGTANASVQALMSRVKGYIDAKIAPYVDDSTKVLDALKPLGGNLATQWAGRIPLTRKAIEDVLKGKGNIREAITLFNAFVDKILTPDLANPLVAAPMAKLLPEVQELEPDAVKRDQAAQELYEHFRSVSQAKVESVTGKDWDPVARENRVPGQQGETRKQSTLTPVPSTSNPIEGAAHRGGANSGVPTSDGRYPATAEVPKRENDAWWLHNMTVAEFTRLGGVLSETEKKLFNEGIYRQALADRKASIVDKASFKKAKKEAEEEAKKYVPWAAGLMGYDLKWESANAVNQAFHHLSVPVGAGVSGTTARTMASLDAIGIGATQALKICLGYLLPIQAHSFAEIRQAANGLGCPGYTPMRGSHNYNQAPIKGDVEAMPGWVDFDRDYSPQAIGDVAKNK